MHLRNAAILFCLFCCVSLNAQILPFHSYTTRDGLPSNTITALYQDSRGFLWIGTNNGLSIYDGASFRNYTAANGLSNNWVTSIAESRTTPGRMWLGTIAGGINRWERGTWTTINIDTSYMADGYVGSVLEDYQGNLWCSSRLGVFVLNDSGLSRLNIAPQREDAVEIALISDSLIWVAMSRHLYVFTRAPNYDREIHLPLGDKGTITTLSQGTDGTVWVGLSDSSLIQIRDTIISVSTKLRSGIPSQIISLPAGQAGTKGLLWVRTYDHIVTLSETEPDIQKPLLYRNEKGIPPAVPLPILIDREDNLWIGGWVNGLHKLADRSFVHVPLGDSDAGAINVHTSADSNGHLWVGSLGGVWEFYRGETEDWNRTFHPLLQGTLNNPFLVDPLHRLWVVSNDWEQLHCYRIAQDAQASSRLFHLQTLDRRVYDPEGSFLGFYIDRRGHVWIATGSGIVVVDFLTKRILSRYPTTPSRPFGHVTAMYHDPEDRMWVGTFNKGLYVIRAQPARRSGGDGHLVRRLTKADGLPGDEIRSIFRDGDGQMWIGTRHSGLALMVKNDFRTLSMRDGLASNAIWAMHEDAQGRLWLQTDVGLVSIDRQNLRPLPLKPELVGEAVNTFGIYKNEFLWCKALSALTIMDFSKESHSMAPPPVHIQSFEAGGELFRHETEIELAHSQNTLTFEYVGISLRNEKGVRYRYRMLGIDTTWSQPNNQRRVTFATVDPGSYTFQVEAISGDGIPSIQPASASFIIIPPFWQRWWFVSLAVAAVSSILWTLYRYRIKKIVEMERLRVRIAGDLHDDVGTNLSSIQVASQIMERQASLSEQDRTQLREIGAIATSTQEMMRDIVWMLNPKNDTLDDFLLKMKEVAARLLQGMRYTFVAPDGRLLDKVSIEFKRNIFLIFKEALNNIVRHAAATEAVIRVEQEDGIFSLEIKDNGKGFELEKFTAGNGLSNMRRRAAQIGGSIEITSKPGEGTFVTLSVKNHANA